MKRRSGFSMVEMLVALTIFTLLSASVYALLHMGMHARGAAGENSGEDHAVRMLYQLMTKDASGMVNESPEWPFEGGAEKMSFIAVVDRWDTHTGRSRRELARVIYAYDPARGTLSRRVAGVSEGLDESLARETFSGDVRRAKFSYPSRRGTWQSVFDGDGIPTGIRMRIGDYETVIAVPMGSLQK